MSLIILVPALLVGLVVGFFVRKFVASKKVAEAESRAQKVLDESRVKAQQVVLDANTAAIKVLDDAKREDSERRKSLDRIENLLTAKESDIAEKGKVLESSKEALTKKESDVDTLKGELDEIRGKQIVVLEKASELSRDQASP